jgi:hypothetical protein
MIITFYSGVRCARSLYCWKDIPKIYNFIVKGFDKFLNYFPHFSILISGTLLAALEKEMPQS